MRSYIPDDAVLTPDNAKRVFKGVIYEVYQWQQQLFDGSHKTFEMLKRPDTVKVIAIKNGKIIILKQSQPNYRHEFYDIPGGMHDNEDENELQAIQRELLEETGMTFKNWRLIVTWQTHTKMDQFVYIFLAWDFDSQIQPKLDPGERIEVIELTLDDAIKLSKDPHARYMPGDILESVGTVEDLLQKPSLHGY